MKKIYIIFYIKDSKKQLIKYFNSIKEKDRFKNKIKYSKNIFIIEDSEDTIFTD